MSVTIPESHKDLIETPIVVTLATVMPNGQPHTTAIWRYYNGTHIVFTTSRGTQKEKNLQANPRASVLAFDPKNPYRYLEIRGEVETITEEGGLEQLDKMTQYYTNQPTYYGHIVPAEEKGTRTHLLCKIKPTKVYANG